MVWKYYNGRNIVKMLFVLIFIDNIVIDTIDKIHS